MFRDYRTGYWSVRGPMDKGFEKRVKWITACANVAAFRIHQFDFYKTNTSKYFIEVHSIYLPKRYPSGYALVSYDLQSFTCYFLGTWPNFWNVANKKIVFAHDLMTYDAYSIGQNGEMPGVTLSQDESREIKSIEDNYGKEMMINYLYPENMSKEVRDDFFSIPRGIGTLIDHDISQVAFFQSKEDLIEMLRIGYAVQARQLNFSNCIKRTFPPPTKPAQYKIIDPEGAKDFPGIPIDQLDKPLPEKAPEPGPLPNQILIRLTIALGVIKATQLNGWDLYITIQEVK